MKQRWSWGNIPIVYAFIYKRIKDKNKKVVGTHDLKEIIARILAKAGGIPKCFTYDIIQDMEYFQLLRRIDHTKYQILQNKCEKKLKKFIW